MKLNLVSLVFTLVAILLLMIALAGVVIAPIVFSAVGLWSLLSLAIAVLRWPLLLILAAVGLAAIYRYGPSRREARWQWLSVGSVAAAIGWLISSVLFSWYIAHFRARCDLRIARRRRRHDDVDVDLRHRDSAWRRTQCRDRTSDGHTAYVGVMAQEVQAVMPEAVTRGADGYMRVSYEKLGLPFETYQQWIASGAHLPSVKPVQH